ncbi:adenine nucleotide alpha hydrolase [Actibacterium sp. XHP0104]|uniref:adenine nucleotide alpha hydrolase n=1 Tax=Actibacterium sp. XHP0104 TaxID=2984335 RepID=UPI0021E9246E|nr:adenine nucleotide alpha hydrolase [Actibacterium sp. XHP0104]MCV2881385.1 adenine nucleotide alpha hydrolase [Actibacterium sp. XHP0104]
MSAPRAALSWSSGKDCAFALHETRRQGLADVVAALTTTHDATGTVAMHGTRNELLTRQVAAMGLEQITVPLPWPCSNADYEARMETAVAQLKSHGITHMIFGDLFLEDVRQYREAKLAGTGITPLFPLWGRDTAALAREMIAQGFDTRIVTVDLAKLDASFAGRKFDESFLADLPPGIDPCGENGEFHTAVVAGPIFDAPIPVQTGETTTRDGFAYADLIPC